MRIMNELGEIQLCDLSIMVLYYYGESNYGPRD